MSFLIHLNFSPLAGIIFFTYFLLKLHYMDTLKSLKIWFSTCTASWCFVRCPPWFTSSSLPLQVKYLFSIKIHGYVKITFHHDSAHAQPLGVYLISFSRTTVSRILCIHMMFVEFLWVCTKQFCIKLQSNNIDGDFVPIIFNSPAIRAKDLFLVQTYLCTGIS